ncbi:hypothetical protein [Chryseobacterium sp.]|uniref:hypothetical protein n=1 Tax=Chryseobacterium sp. TaxID=1871047 RepID=UPI0011CA1E1F|nr:hypothetical protein [Chryseobacterium sp.]TXF75909.1 hypothetical protein FUA25_08365 [Chryseobacterium sp.]
MNILDHLEFSTHKANVIAVKKSDRINSFAVALGIGAVLKKHVTPVPTTLIVLKGEINFVFADREMVLRELDVFQIPVGEVHEVFGVLEQNLFLITQEL